MEKRILQSKIKPQCTIPPITRQGSRSKTLSQMRAKLSQTSNPPPLIRTSTPTESLNLSLTDNQSGSQSGSQPDSQYLYENTQTENTQTNYHIIPINLSTPPSQMAQHQPTRSETNLLDENMDTNQDQLSDSITNINLLGILNKTMQQPPQPNSQIKEVNDRAPFLESRGKRLKAALIILAKSSHHKTFMETCMARHQPPKNMSLWVQPHIYHSNAQVEKHWRDTLHEAGLNLTSILIKHYASVIKAEQETIETIRKEVIDYIKQANPREEAIQTWKTLSKQAETEARQLSNTVKETNYTASEREQGVCKTFYLLDNDNRLIPSHSYKP